MGWAVVISDNGFGIPVTESELGIPVDVSDNGFGQPVVLVESGGLSVIGAGDAPPIGYGFLTDFDGNSLFDADGVRLYGAI